MPLENRVDPFGAVHAVTERGSLMGNRGIIHDPRTRTLLKKRWKTRAWIICLCAFKARKRTVMAPRCYTELFFLDEATALAAGHRPCFACQRQRAMSFAAAFAAGCRQTTISAGDIDARLHRERLAAGNAPQVLSHDGGRSLPDGSMIASHGDAFLVMDGHALPWSFGGYGNPLPFDNLEARSLSLLTPQSTVRALRAGYAAQAAIDPTT